MIDTCRALGVEAARRDGHPGCWVDPDGPAPRKIGALGLRVERGVSYHGIALNVTVELADFDLIDPCGMPGVVSTSDRRRARPARRRRPRLRSRPRAAISRRPGGALGIEGAPRSRPPSPRPRSTRSTDPRRGRGLTCRPGCSSCARTRSPAGGSRRSSIAPSTATGSPGPPSRWTIGCSAARTARRRPATGCASGCSRTSRSTWSGPTTTPASSTADLAQVALAQARASGTGGPSSRRPGSIAPSTPSATTSSRGSSPAPATRWPRRATRPDRLPAGRPELGRAGRRADQPPVPRPVRPAADPAPHRRGARRRRALRDPRGRVPVLPPRPRGVEPAGAARLGGPPQRRVRAVRVALTVRDLDRAPPPRRRLRRATPADVAATAEALRQVLGRLAVSLDGPPYNLVLHTAPLREQVDATYHWHWEIHPRLREIAGLELGTGLPVNPVSPEDAVEELLGRAEPREVDRVNGADARASHEGRVHRHWAQRARAAHSVHRHHPARSLRVQRPIDPARPFGRRARSARGPRHERHLGPGRGRGVRRDAVREAPRRDLRVPAAHDARPGARRRPDPGRVRQGVQELRHAREAGERARLAVPDRPSRGARRDPPAQDHPVPAVDR